MILYKHSLDRLRVRLNIILLSINYLSLQLHRVREKRGQSILGITLTNLVTVL